MNDEAVTEKLAAALVQMDWGTQEAEEIGNALLPVVRGAAADELREVASALGAMAAQGVHVPTVGLVMAYLRNRADALTKPPDGPDR